MKWILIEKLERFNRWKNRKGNYYECFWPGIDPNKIVEEKEEKINTMVKAQSKVKNRKRNKSIVINNRYTEMRY